MTDKSFCLLQWLMPILQQKEQIERPPERNGQGVKICDILMFNRYKPVNRKIVYQIIDLSFCPQFIARSKTQINYHHSLVQVFSVIASGLCQHFQNVSC